jgi:hypothetical protein
VPNIFGLGAPTGTPGGGGKRTWDVRATPGTTLAPAAERIERTELDRANVLSLASPGRVTVEVFAITGQRVKTPVDAEFGIGRFPLSWDGRDEAGQRMPSGIYFYRVNAPGLHVVRKVSLLR